MDDRNDAAYGPSSQTGHLSLAAYPAQRLRRFDREIPLGWRFGKRTLDLVGSVTALTLLSPVMLGVGVTLAFTGGSVLFRQKRVGLNGQIFSCLKFRSMVPDAERVLREMIETDPVAREEWARTQKLRRDPRITRFGRFLRRSSIDELPQLINVLKGDMSLIGPRPAMPDQMELYGRSVRDYCAVRPGITGLWQVTARGNSDFRRRVALDCYYAKNCRPTLDLGILLRTIVVVVRGTGAH